MQNRDTGRKIVHIVTAADKSAPNKALPWTGHNEELLPSLRWHRPIIKEKCPKCRGKGRVKKRKKIHVKIPAGIDDGQQLRVAGQGEPGINGGPPGDLYIVFIVKEHEFCPDGMDIYCEMPITFAQAALW